MKQGISCASFQEIGIFGVGGMLTEKTIVLIGDLAGVGKEMKFIYNCCEHPISFYFSDL